MNDLVFNIAAALNEDVSIRAKRDKMQRYIAEWYAEQDALSAPSSVPGRAYQAAAWLQDRPFARTVDAARLFGLSVGAVATVRQSGPCEPYRGPHNAVPDPVPANLPVLLDAVRWFRADEYRRTEKMAAAMFRVKVSDMRRAMYYADREDPDEVPPR